MADLKFKCSQCNQIITTYDYYCGTEVICPFCSNVTTVPARQKENSNETPTAYRKSQVLFAVISILALLVSIATLVINQFFTNCAIPQLPMSSDPSEAVRERVAFEIKCQSLVSHFWNKNGNEILKSIDIKEIKRSGDYAVAFYKLSFGVTEVKDAMFLYKTKEGYWIKVPAYHVEIMFPTKFYKDMDEQVNKFKKDSGEFDEFDI